MTLNNENKAGILLHISSLVGREGIGTLGKEAHALIDYLSAAGQRIWQNQEPPVTALYNRYRLVKRGILNIIKNKEN